jgi:hypothetical protein
LRKISSFLVLKPEIVILLNSLSFEEVLKVILATINPERRERKAMTNFISMS